MLKPIFFLLYGDVRFAEAELIVLQRLPIHMLSSIADIQVVVCRYKKIDLFHGCNTTNGIGAVVDAVLRINS